MAVALGAAAAGSRRTGAGAWLIVRVSALVIAIGLLGLVALVAQSPRFPFVAWRALCANPALEGGITAWLAAVTLHAYFGFDGIVKDYVHSPRVRLVALAVVALGLAAFFAYGLMAVFA